MHRPFRCPVLVTGVVVGGAALLAIAAYYYWSQKKKSSDTSSATSSESNDVVMMSSSEPRADGGADSKAKFNIEDENVRRVCEKLFMEQMDLGEAYLEDEETEELGAIHMANAIVLTGETAQLLKVLRGSISPAHFANIQKYLPSADLRVHQLLQDELAIETIAQHFD
ncbi:Peroxisome biogenesis protein 3-2-like [Caenorhabditis elegans]|uniref:Peroxisome biogenesis protein 3-2-like n=1 Tax=Caenorhabditis elegans TaxID=6239 RepID=O62204_CAEEL|nr:Peroxisome biogenesis protein 3-2-like [Caenorhabditis elegans]CAB04234.2 Peroxisome biogenesis protein 3-2-like [Caenorhabditis elegans]|eukprot:NP_492941.2 Uncharacterized protein CELE_F32B4.2 [Caenorhabditis elegans]